MPKGRTGRRRRPAACAGLDGLEERSRHLPEARWLADEYGLSAVRVRQLETNAMKKLRGRVIL